MFDEQIKAISETIPEGAWAVITEATQEDDWVTISQEQEKIALVRKHSDDIAKLGFWVAQSAEFKDNPIERKSYENASWVLYRIVVGSAHQPSQEELEYAKDVVVAAYSDDQGDRQR